MHTMHAIHTVQGRGMVWVARTLTLALPAAMSCLLTCFFCAAARPCTAQLLSSCNPRASADFDGWFNAAGGGDSDSARKDPLYYILGFASLLSFVHFDQLGGPSVPTRSPVTPSQSGTQSSVPGVGNGGDAGSVGSGGDTVSLPGNTQADNPGTVTNPGGSQPGTSGATQPGATQPGSDQTGAGGNYNGGGGDNSGGSSPGGGGSGGNGGSGDANGGGGNGGDGGSPGIPGTIVGDNPWNGAPPGSPSTPSNPSGPSTQAVTPEPGPAAFGVVLAGTLMAAGAARIRAARAR